MVQIFLVSRDKFKVLNRPKPVALPVLDGIGYLLDKENNAIAKADRPYWNELQKDWTMTLLRCCGSVVGLSGRQMSNSEAGHFHIDTPRYVPHDFCKVHDAMVDIRNYADCDTVGHTGIMDVTILAVKVVNASLRLVVDALSVGVQMLITAGHGNIEQMVDEGAGQPHTINSVSSVYVGGNLFDLASTVPAMSGVFQPVEMTGRSLIKSV